MRARKLELDEAEDDLVIRRCEFAYAPEYSGIIQGSLYVVMELSEAYAELQRVRARLRNSANYSQLLEAAQDLWRA